MAAVEGDQPDELARAYEQRTIQLYETRALLAESVSTLSDELRHRREEAATLRDQSRDLHEQAVAHAAEIQRLRDHTARLEADLAQATAQLRALQRMKIVRWTVWPRRAVYRLRARRNGR